MGNHTVCSHIVVIGRSNQFRCSDPKDHDSPVLTRYHLVYRVSSGEISLDSFRNLNKEETLESLRSALHSREALYFVGAGCSQGLGFPGWGALIKDLVEKFGSEEIQYDQNSNLLDVALEVKGALTRKNILAQYHSYFYGKFKEPPPKVGVPDKWPESRLHELLFKFPIKSLVTTNYDPALEYYIKTHQKNVHVDRVLPYAPGPAGDFLFCLKEDSIFQGVLHLHGDYQEAQNIILTREDYNLAYKPYLEENGQKIVLNSPHKKILWTLLTTRCLIFVGFSLSDEYLNEILKEVCADVWGSFREKHFAIFPYDPRYKSTLEDQRDLFLRQYSIQTVFYNSKNQHEELLELLEFLQLKEEKIEIAPQANAEVAPAEKEKLIQKMKDINKKAVPLP